ncbi:hypothetical protein M4951_10765 [Blastopirellula sp. J2-11]|uniref:hypothetical protein n=1 Tax=Blastopirellula sp. J2-11 TaxID=2943192 RepID=UPI0021C8A64A|nr:hypothetical protein [Blastopirellula sp. J2-11]UUO08772.1 hypothetical protein M4951_10765 [Blastopirellula sp. J2-11]
MHSRDNRAHRHFPAIMNSPIPPSLWLAANQRPAQVAALFSTIFFACSGLSALLRSPVAGGFALGLLAAAIVAAVVTFRLWQPPRIRYEHPNLVLRFPGAGAFHVPLEAIECFFIGVAKYEAAGSSPPRESVAVVVRLAERAREWKQRDVPAEYGRWCDGYVVLDGTWCEPIAEAKVLQLNRWLVDAKKMPATTGIEK